GWGHHGRAKYITSRAIGVVILEVLSTKKGYYRSRVTISSTGGLLIRFSYRRQPRRLLSSNPSSSRRSCARLICVTATSSFGHWNVACSNRLLASQKPLPSKSKQRIRLRRRLQKAKIEPVRASCRST